MGCSSGSSLISNSDENMAEEARMRGDYIQLGHTSSSLTWKTTPPSSTTSGGQHWGSASFGSRDICHCESLVPLTPTLNFKSCNNLKGWCYLAVEAGGDKLSVHNLSTVVPGWWGWVEVTFGKWTNYLFSEFVVEKKAAVRKEGSN